jgi:hypothetical protein
VGYFRNFQVTTQSKESPNGQNLPNLFTLNMTHLDNFDGVLGRRVRLEVGDQLFDGFDVALQNLGHDCLRHERQDDDGHLVLLAGADVRQRVRAEAWGPMLQNYNFTLL